MYGKLFVRMYQGSMVGAGSTVFAIWGYCIANADPEGHTVDLNPALLATVIGDDVEDIKKAIAFLSAPDPNSHNKEEEGRRIVHTTGFEYFLVSHEMYRNMTNNEDLRAYFREQKRKQRKKDSDVKDNLGHSKDPASASACAYDFDLFWKEYPRKTGKAYAKTCWIRHKPPIAKCLDTLDWQRKSDEWTKDGGDYVPHPSTWINQGRWEDEPKEEKTAWVDPNPESIT